MDTDFKPMGYCVGRPKGWRASLADFLCKHTGHILWRTGSRVDNPTGSLSLFGCYCRRCFVRGYVEGDY